MKKIFIILIVIIIVVGIGFAIYSSTNSNEKELPTSFTLKNVYDGKILGNANYYIKDEKYYYTLDYGITANIEQETLKEIYIKKYKESLKQN